MLHELILDHHEGINRTPHRAGRSCNPAPFEHGRVFGPDPPARRSSDVRASSAAPSPNSLISSVPKIVRILLVDDHPLMRAGVKALFDEESDLRVVAEAADGVSAVRLVAELALDVVVLDLSLPQLGGVEAAEQMLIRKPELRILALSAHAEAAYASLMLEAGAAGYALKRSACSTLVGAVRVVASGGTYIDPGLPRGRSLKRRQGVPELLCASLSERELEVVRLNAQGLTSKEVAQRLSLSPRTLETYKARAMTKLNLSSRAELLNYALCAGWLKLA